MRPTGSKSFRSRSSKATRRILSPFSRTRDSRTCVSRFIRTAASRGFVSTAKSCPTGTNDTATTEIYTLSLHDVSDLGGRRIIDFAHTLERTGLREGATGYLGERPTI